MKNKREYLIITLVILVFFTGFLFYMKSSSEITTIPYIEFMKNVDDGLVEEVRVGDSSDIIVTLKNGQKKKTDNPRTEDFKKELLLKNIKVVEETVGTRNVFMFFGLSVGLVIFIILLRKNMSKEVEREINDLSKIDGGDYNTGIKFSDVAGNEEAKDTLEEMVDFIKNPELYSSYGARLPRGVLLYGPPGTGKTLLAKALAGEAGVPIFPVSGSDFVQVYAGVGASRIRSLFKEAKEAGKSVIFIDEIDSLGKKRKGNNPAGSEEGDRTLNALLAEMSGFKDNDGIIVVAATNRIDVLDEALLRPGRFDRQVEVQLPDINAREKILKLHCRNKPLSKDVNIRRLAQETVYFSGAKLENLLNESAMIAARSKDKEITNEHIDKAYFKVLVGDEKKDRSSISIKERKITAYHEAGHALIAKVVAKEHRVTKVSIIPSTKGMGGFSLNIPPDKMYQTKNDILNSIMIALAGRAAEEIVFGRENITTGASSDLEKATETVLSMLGIYGMDSSFGLLNYNIIMSKDINQDGQLLAKSNEILESLYLKTINILNDFRIELDRLANGLLEKEVLGEDEINEIILGNM
ncbi:ATP-dependent metallopeptidase FtsH/Yme1/Tma family protein [Wansuia hejianensis]|uniref:ATP-dependent zinc metalloprotease FtsH n=1 Tax=Wansuia hejianensis TaxID=2763667 RepID=A0A926IMD2_9FIRM|nr:ATP-dependent metallopeptidase FtsH/Yme1/Tma family protein [Wansuia hejianensis]MBC8589543.1 ATP-dependent metallopeptidase FtsH/Yme1/Tma family protein [Wansuia hejianensis]